jgi:lactate permease
VRQTWPAALLAGGVFAVAQFVTSNYLSVQLTDIVASLLSAGAVVLLVRAWQPTQVLTAELADAEVGESANATPGSAGRGSTARGGASTVTASRGAAGGAVGGGIGEGVGGGVDGAVGGDRRPRADDRSEVLRAYAPYLVIIAIFSITNIPAVVDFLAKEPWTYLFDWPGLHIVNSAGDPVVTQFKLNWLPAAGTLLIIAGLISMLILKVAPARAFRTYLETYVELRSAIITVMAVLALAYVMNLSGQTTSLGVWLAGAGGLFAILSPILGWIGVAVTGSDTSSNSLFGALQVQAATKAGLDPVLMAAANSSGGVLGKMVSPQNLAIAAAAVGMAGREGEIFRKVIGWSLVMLVLMCVIVGLQATPVLGWMVP